MADKAYEEAWVDLLNAMPKVGLDETVDTGSYSYRYATLSHIIGLIRPILKEHGFAFTQNVVTQHETVTVKTTFWHTTGEGVSFGPLAFSTNKDPKAVGSAITYARRYQLTAALGIAPEDDDDGTRAAEAANVREQKPPTEKPSDWLAVRVAMFTQWDEDERREQYTDAMKALEIERFQTMEHAEQVFDRMQEAYYLAFPPTDDEAPF